jgi:hypothetical protein
MPKGNRGRSRFENIGFKPTKPVRWRLLPPEDGLLCFMAKRFIDTTFFKSPFVRGLQGAYKGLYLFIICDCDGSGIWAADFEAASLYIGQKVDISGFQKFFIERGKAIDLENGRYFLPDFIEHQYPGGLSTNNTAHKNFIAELLKFNLLDEDLKPLQSPFKGSKVKVMVKEKVEAMVMVKAESEISEFGFFAPLIERWVQYKKSRKESYKSDDGLRTFAKKLHEFSKGDVQLAEKIIDQSIGNNYAGIFELKTLTGFPNQQEKKSARDSGMEALQRLMNQPD